MSKDLKEMYKTIMDDHFTPRMEISFVDGEKRQTLIYEKVSWVIDGVNKGLRYGASNDFGIIFEKAACCK